MSMPVRAVCALCLWLVLWALPVQAEDWATYQQERHVYVDRIDVLIRQQVDMRFYNARIADLEATVRLDFTPDGRFQSLLFEERSGDYAFDAAVESALRRAVGALPPAPVPPGAQTEYSIPVRICAYCR